MLKRFNRILFVLSLSLVGMTQVASASTVQEKLQAKANLICEYLRGIVALQAFTDDAYRANFASEFRNWKSRAEVAQFLNTVTVSYGKCLGTSLSWINEDSYEAGYVVETDSGYKYDMTMKLVSQDGARKFITFALTTPRF